MDETQSTPFGYCQCGCGERTNLARRTDTSKGWTVGQPLRHIRGHSGGPGGLKNLSPEGRFWARVDKETSDRGCWLWKGAWDGYGRLGVEGERVPAHRFAYELLVGLIPEGLVIDHLCRTPRCVNPDHLEPVTQSENLRRAVREHKTHCPHGHSLTGDNLYVRPDGKRACRTCRRETMQRFYARKAAA